MLFYNTMLTQSKQANKQKNVKFVILNRHQTTTDTTDLPGIDQLVLNRYYRYENRRFFFDRLFSALRHLRITCLVIQKAEIFICELIKLILHWLHLESLTVPSLSLMTPRFLTSSGAKSFYLSSKINRIGKIVLEYMYDSSKTQFLLDLFLLVQYLEIGCENDFLLEKFLQIILLKNTKYISQLSKICMKSSWINEPTLNRLKYITDFEQKIAAL